MATKARYLAMLAMSLYKTRLEILKKKSFVSEDTFIFISQDFFRCFFLKYGFAFYGHECKTSDIKKPVSYTYQRHIFSNDKWI